MSDNQYVAMTMNERLFVSGRMDEFDQTVLNQDRELIAKIYIELEAAKDYEEALENADSVLKGK